MYSMSPSDLIDPNVSWQAKVVAWMASQGPITVLLFMIVVGVWQEMPSLVTQAVRQVQTGYVINAEVLQQSAATYQATTERLMQQLMDDRQLMLELAREQKEATQTVGQAVERLSTD